MNDEFRIAEDQRELCALAWATFHSPEGQRFLEHLDERFNSRTSFDPDNAYTTAFHEGRRDVVLYIKSLMKKSRRGRSDETLAGDELTYLAEEDSHDV